MADIRTDEQRLKDIEETASHPTIVQFFQPALLDDIQWLCTTLRHVQAENELLKRQEQPYLTAEEMEHISQIMVQGIEIARLQQENARLREERDSYMQLLQMIVNPCGHHMGRKSIMGMAKTELDKFGRDDNWQALATEGETK